MKMWNAAKHGVGKTSLTQFGLCITETTKTRHSTHRRGEQNQNLSGFNKFQYKSWTGSLRVVRGAVQKEHRPSQIAQRFPSAKWPVAPLSEPEPEWKLVWKLVSADGRGAGRRETGRQPSLGICNNNQSRNSCRLALSTSSQCCAGWCSKAK